MKHYTYNKNTYTTLYALSEAMGKDGIFIPLSINDKALQAHGVEITEIAEPLEDVKQRKIAQLKAQRDTAEVEPIEYNGNSFDYDDKARDRINAAIIALDVQGAAAAADSEGNTTAPSIAWTTADNNDVTVTANDLRMVIAAVAVRSNTLHTNYRVAKEKVEAATTKEEIEAVEM